MPHPATSRFLRLLGAVSVALWVTIFLRPSLTPTRLNRVSQPTLPPGCLHKSGPATVRLNPWQDRTLPQRKRAGGSAPPALFFCAFRPCLAAVAHEPQQEQEHVDEVEVQVERAHD